MADLLEVILANTQLNPQLLLQVACVSKHHNDIATSLWSKVKFTKLFDEQEKPSQLHLISVTDAKKMYYLTESDILNLTIYETYSKKYRKNIRLVHPKEVLLMALVKYGPSQLWQKKYGVKKNNALEKREATLKALNLDFDKNTIKWDLCIADFLKNGKGGKKEIMARLLRYNEFEQRLASVIPENIKCYMNLTEIYELRSTFVRTGGYDLTYVFSRLIPKLERTHIITTSLKDVGLELRSDSKLCKEYIDGERNDLNNVVETMQEMDYFHKNTSYPIILGNLLNNLRQDIRHMYGWLDQEEYHHELQIELPKVSLKAKRLAANEKRNDPNIPDYIRKYIQ